MNSRLLDYVDSNKERFLLIGYFAIILVLAWPLANMLGRAWERAHLFRAVFKLPVYYLGLSFEDVTVLLFGLFIGLLILMTIDPKKRWQAFLLWIGAGIALLGLQSMGLFLPNIDLVKSSAWLAGGMVVGTGIGGGTKLSRVTKEKSIQMLEFRAASKLIFWISTAIVIVAFLEFHVVYNDIFAVSSDVARIQTQQSLDVTFDSKNLPANAVVSGVFVFTMNRFVKYDAEKNFFVLGPKGSGKSLFLVGSYFAALESVRNEGKAPLKPSEDLMSLVDELDRERTGWAIRGTSPGQINNLEFQYVHGTVFPMNVKITSIDYAGEYLGRLPDALLGTTQTNSFEGDEYDDEQDETLERLTIGVENSNILTLIVDVERFMNDEPMEISEYFSILQAADDKEVLLVATKADLLAEDYRMEEGLEPHRHFEDFKLYVTERLRTNKQVETLIQETTGGEIHPVYYQTKKTDSGDRVPMRNEAGEVMTVGYDELLEEIGKW